MQINNYMENKVNQTDWERKYAYLLADFQNYKKQVNKERESAEKYKNKDLLLKLTNVVDNCIRGLEYHDELKPLYDLLLSILKEEGVELIKIQSGDMFTPDKMNAIAAIPSKGENLKHTVANIVNQGYTYKDVILRYANVIVYD